jgi:hypothetical protein
MKLVYARSTTLELSTSKFPTMRLNLPYSEFGIRLGLGWTFDTDCQAAGSTRQVLAVLARAGDFVSRLGKWR